MTRAFKRIRVRLAVEARPSTAWAKERSWNEQDKQDGVRASISSHFEWVIQLHEQL